MNAAIYTRSAAAPGSLDAHRTACDKFARDHGWQPLPTRYDDLGSGLSLDRPGLQRLLADVDAGRVDAVVVADVARLSREPENFDRLLARLTRAGVQVVTPDGVAARWFPLAGSGPATGGAP